MQLHSVLALLLFLTFPSAAFGYVGPGIGLGALGVVLGLVVSVFLALLGLFWYPFKRLLRSRRTKKTRTHD